MADVKITFQADTSQATPAVKALQDALGGTEKQARQTGTAATGAGKAVDGMGDDAADAAKDMDRAGKSSESLATRLNSTLEIAKKFGAVIGAVFRAGSESVKRLAEDGSQSAGVLVGEFTAIQKSADGITESLTNSMAPAMRPVVEEFKLLTEGAADWLRVNEVGKGIVTVTVGTLLITAKTLAAVRDAYLGAAEKAAEYFGVGANKKETDQKILDEAKAVRESGFAYRETTGVMDSLVHKRGELEAIMQENAESVGDFSKGLTLMKPAGDEAAKGLDATIASLEELLKKVRESKTGDLDLSFIDSGKPEKAKSGDDSAKKENDAIKAALAERLALYKDDKDRQLEIVTEKIAELEVAEVKHTDVLAGLYTTRMSLISAIDEEEYQKTVEKGLERQEEAEARQDEQNEKWVEGQEKRAEKRKELLEDELADIERTSTSEEEAAERTIEALKRGLQERELTVERRLELNKMLGASETNLTNIEIAETKKRNATIFALTTTAATQLFEQKRKFGNVLVTLGDGFAKQQISTLSDQTMKELSLIQSAGAGKAREAAIDMARSKGTMAAALAAAFAPLGPFAIPATAAAIAALSALVNKFASVIKFASGGGVGERIAGTVPGVGNQDTVQALLTPREFVVREPSASPPRTRGFLDDLNKTGDLAGAARRAGVGDSGAIAVSGSGGSGERIEIVLSFDSGGDPLVGVLADHLSAAVRSGRATLVSSHGIATRKIR